LNIWLGRGLISNLADFGNQANISSDESVVADLTEYKQQRCRLSTYKKGKETGHNMTCEIR